MLRVCGMGVAVLALTASIAGCSSGGDDGNPAAGPVSITGIWDGDFLSTGNIEGDVREVDALILHEGRLMMVDGTNIIYDGPYEASGSRGFAVSEVRRFNHGTPGGGNLDNLRLDGQISADGLLRVRAFRLGLTDPSEIHVDRRDDIYREVTDMGSVAHSWLGATSPTTLSLTITPQGTVSGFSGAGGTCFFTAGTIEQPDPTLNLYGIAFNTSGGCSIPNTRLTGFAYLHDGGLSLRIIVAAPAGALHLQLRR